MSTPLTTVNTAIADPIPSVTVSMATILNPGIDTSERAATFKSRSKLFTESSWPNVERRLNSVERLVRMDLMNCVHVYLWGPRWAKRAPLLKQEGWTGWSIEDGCV